MTEETPPTGFAAKVERKRKRQAEDASKQTKPAAPADNHASEPPSKKKRKAKGKGKGKDKPTGQVKELQDSKDKDAIRENAFDEAIGKMDGRLLADHFAKQARRLNKELTAVEENDLWVSGMLYLYPRAWCRGADLMRFRVPRYLVF